MRKLVTIRQITDIREISGANNIELAIIDGWQVVVKKDTFIRGDCCLYFELDSWVPVTIAPFLVKDKEPKKYYGIPGIRLTTIKLRGQISQGLALPIGDVFNRGSDYYINPSGHLGEDLSSVLGVIKYEGPELTSKKNSYTTRSPTGVRYPFPSIIPKTDQERIQNLDISDILNKGAYAGNVFEVTEKLEGTSCTIYLDEENNLKVCSRNHLLPDSGSGTIYGMIADKYGFRDKLRKYTILDRLKERITRKPLPRFPRKEGYYGYAFQGEIVGPKLQGNIYKLQEPEFFIYDIFDFYNAKYLTPTECRRACHELGLQHVPVIDNAYVLNRRDMTDDFFRDALIRKADGKTLIGNNHDQNREGLVFKIDPGEIEPLSGYDRVSFKVISNEYLLTTKV